MLNLNKLDSASYFFSKNMDELDIYGKAVCYDGIMIGRGLLANPALALEYRQNRTLELDEIREKLQSMHKCVYNQYAEQLEGGDEQLLNKMKTFWEYLMPQADRKLLKAIHKSTNLIKYNAAIGLI